MLEETNFSIGDQLGTAATVHVVGPELTRAGRWVFLCPVCDDDFVTGLEGAEVVCTAEWLDGQPLTGDTQVDGRACVCFHTDPYEGEPEATNANRRFYLYRTIALLLGGAGRRVDLPACVKERIQELYGNSEVGFQSN